MNDFSFILAIEKIDYLGFAFLTQLPAGFLGADFQSVSVHARKIKKAYRKTGLFLGINFL